MLKVTLKFQNSILFPPLSETVRMLKLKIFKCKPLHLLSETVRIIKIICVMMNQNLLNFYSWICLAVKTRKNRFPFWNLKVILSIHTVWEDVLSICLWLLVLNQVNILKKFPTSYINPFAPNVSYVQRVRYFYCVWLRFFVTDWEYHFWLVCSFLALIKMPKQCILLSCVKTKVCHWQHDLIWFMLPY